MPDSDDHTMTYNEAHQEISDCGQLPSITSTEVPRILDAVADQQGGYWIRFGTMARSFWFSLAELQTDERKVFSRLSGPGMTFLTPPTKNAFKRLIEEHIAYRPALVAEHPGWVGGSHYVFGNRHVIAPPGD
ncbi:hypothetical protein [Microvirga aerophila]|uniref:Uncharacterized protein n=1 Tax=Microvirga aerophila TaxID=670291 RepID=A0A512C1G5_9HYPH|nr:hypothetical protein [Microvirga aerophila]GEO18064.1 hypothetical protein MAE02_57600 [Microvirga aerophila]